MHGPPETSMGENGEVSQATGAAGSEGAAAAGTGPRSRVVVVGSGPGGYEAALVAAQLGADVTVVDRDGVGGACVLTDCVPSKTLISAAEQANNDVDVAAVNARVLALAFAQSA